MHLLTLFLYIYPTNDSFFPIKLPKETDLNNIFYI